MKAYEEPWRSKAAQSSISNSGASSLFCDTSKGTTTSMSVHERVHMMKRGQACLAEQLLGLCKAIQGPDNVCFLATVLSQHVHQTLHAERPACMLSHETVDWVFLRQVLILQTSILLVLLFDKGQNPVVSLQQACNVS